MSQKGTPVETSEMCCYGCGNKAEFISKSGTYRCSEYLSQCPVNRKKNKAGLDKAYENSFSRSGIKKDCGLIEFKSTYLYIKTHNKTGLKYFGKTSKDPYTYNGSGKRWLDHLKEHGEDVSTQILGFFTDKDECAKAANEFSISNDIVKSPNWANFMNETGIDGGNSIQGRRWANNGTEEKYVYELEEGWSFGRLAAHCVFLDRKKQGEFGKRAQTEEVKKKRLSNGFGEKISKSKKGKPNIKLRGDNNPTKRNIVREKIGKANSKSLVTPYGVFDSIKDAVEKLNVTRNFIDKNRKWNPNEWYIKDKKIQ